jgi:hypothetical protein
VSGVSFGVGDDAVYAFSGFVSGITMQVRTTQYQSAVIQITHATLTDMFDKWMDAVARSAPHEFSHVYEWGNEFGDVSTVGSPAFRLWKHVLIGTGKDRSATFVFTPSVRPTPVDPILAEKGVKEGVHIFHMKAAAMEYGIDIEVNPKIAKMLAYVDDRPETSGGYDSGYHHSNPDHDTPGAIHFSEGPVFFKAGGGKFQGKFTSAFVGWWATQADDAFNTAVKPRLEADLVPRDKLGQFIAKGNRKATEFGGKTKSFAMGAQSSAKQALFHDAMNAAKRDLEGKANNYIEEARIRRKMIYGV